MEKSSTRILSIILSLLLAVTLLAGCKKSNSNSSQAGNVQSVSGDQQQAATGEQTSAPRENIKLTWASIAYGPIDKDSLAMKELEKRFPDVEFDLQGYDWSTYNDQLNTKVAGGDIPDILMRWGRSDVAQYVKQGVLGEVPYDVIKQYAPNFYASSIKFGKDIWIVVSIDGKNYGLPQMLSSSFYDVFNMGWRKDLLDTAGITKIPETLAEYEEAFKKIKELPGKKDMYGLSANMKDGGFGYFTSIFTAYGVAPANWCLQPDGTVKMGITTPQAKAAFATLNKWYKLGYIDKEFIITDWTTWSKKWTEGKAITNENAWYYLLPGLANYDDLVKNVSGAKVAIGPAPKGPEGKYGFVNWSRLGLSYCFGKNLAANPDKLHRVLQVVDQMESDKDLNLIINMGKEGVHWKRDDHNGIIAIAPYNDGKNCGPIGNQLFLGGFGIPEVVDTYQRNDLAEVNKYASDGNVKNGTDYFLWLDMFTSPDLAMQVQNSQKVAAKYMVGFITGELSLDKFDQFVKEWEDAGGKAMTEDANKAYIGGKAQLDDIASKIN